VFGAGGGASPDKRVPMGQAVGRYADVAFVTNDNPRDDDPADIANALVAGLDGTSTQTRVVLDRADAIEQAMALATPGDIVVVAGKGHEQGQTQGGKTVPFSDRAELMRWVQTP
jgi:UDP-N-acetylmuramoyl-L-alanyl-D-glutamate--2,6-diaminopimelate ligase